MNWAETPAMLARARAEQPVAFAGMTGRLFGIFTPAAPDATNARTCVIFPGRPRFGVRRLPVLAARTLAADGFAALRFDLRGHGESDGKPALPNREDPYGEDTVAAIRHMRAHHGQTRFVLVGYCSDALSALNAFEQESSAIAGLFFAVAAVLQERLAGDRFPAQMGAGTGNPQMLASFALPFRALAVSCARALFLYGEEDRLRAEFRIAEQQLFSQLDTEARGRLRTEIWKGRIHTIEAQPAIFERAISWIREFHPARCMADTSGETVSSPNMREEP